jgi:hypothetical protein
MQNILVCEDCGEELVIDLDYDQNLVEEAEAQGWCVEPIILCSTCHRQAREVEDDRLWAMA